MSSKPSAVLFDLDGTLLDSVELIRRSWRYCLSEHGIEGVSDEELLGGMGTPLETQMLHFAGRLAASSGDESREEQAAEMARTYRAFNREQHARWVRSYPGVTDLILELRERGLPMGVVTSKSRRPALLGLESLGLEFLGEHLVGADDIDRHKPDPAPILAGAELVGIAPEHLIYVGDAPVDIQAGKAAGAATAGVTWGPFERERLQLEEPDFLCESAGDLRGCLLAD